MSVEKLIAEMRTSARTWASERNAAFDRYGMNNTPEQTLEWRAADALSLLLDHIKALTEALEPFAEAATKYETEWVDNQAGDPMPEHLWLDQVEILHPLGDYLKLFRADTLRNARAALTPSSGSAGK